MAHIFVKNSLSELKAAKISVNIPTVVTTTSKGDPIFVLEVATTYPSVSGTNIRPTYVDKVKGIETLDDAVDNSVSIIASQIDWTPLSIDDTPPYVDEISPVGNNVSIASNVFINIKDITPSAGIDLTDAQVFLHNGFVEFDITEECEVEGTPFSYNLYWQPPLRIMK